MVFGLFGGGSRKAQASDLQAAPGLGDLKRLAAAVAPGTSASEWAMVSDADNKKKPKVVGPQPYKVEKHTVKTRLKGASTAVVNMSAVVDADHCVLFDLLADPHQHENIFDAIESADAELLSEEGSVKRWRLDYRARWKFWRVGGVCDNRLWMTTDRDKGTVSFELREPGFLRAYEGTWTITGPNGLGPGTAPVSAPAAARLSLAPSPTPSLSRSSSLSRQEHDVVSAGPAPQAGGLMPHPLSDLLGSRTSSTASSLAACSASTSSSSSSSSGGSDGRTRSNTPGPSPAETPRFGGSSVHSLLASINNPFMAAQQQQQQQQQQLRLPLRQESKGGAGASATDATAPPAPRFPTTIRVEKLMSPKISPPYPLNQVLKGHAAGQVGDMLEGLLVATARVVGDGEVGEAAAGSISRAASRAGGRR